MPGSVNTQDEDMPGKTVPGSKEIAQQTISRVITNTIAKVEELEKKKATETSPTKEEALEKEISKGKELLTGAMVVGLAAANKLTAPKMSRPKRQCQKELLQKQPTPLN